MRIALLADIHGNSIALDAVLEDIANTGGVDAYWVLGDLVALGPDPVGVMERLQLLKGLQMIRGNTDRYVTTGDRPAPSMAEAQQNPALLPALVEVAGTFAWTQGMVTAGGWMAVVAALPLELRVELPNGTQFLGVHASPGMDDGTGVTQQTNEKDIETLFAGCNAQLVCLGHTHQPVNRHWKGIHIVNPGAVSLSLMADRHAGYALLEATKESYTIQHRQVPYNRAAVINQLHHLQHPAKGFLIKHLQ